MAKGREIFKEDSSIFSRFLVQIIGILINHGFVKSIEMDKTIVYQSQKPISHDAFCILQYSFRKLDIGCSADHGGLLVEESVFFG